MVFFTPDLYEQLNDDDPAIVVQAMAAWDAAEAAYLAQRENWLSTAPADVADLATLLCLHDAHRRLEMWTSSGQYLLASLTPDELTILRYDAVEQPRVIPPARTGRCWTTTPMWLYDEITSDAPGRFRHCILFSDSSEREILFRSVRRVVHEIADNLPQTMWFATEMSPGQGDDTAEREALFAGKTVDDISREIEAWKREQSPSPETIATTESGAGGR